MNKIRAERKPRKSVAELYAEIALRLRIAGCADCTVTLRPAIGRRHMIGRNWDVEQAAGGSVACRDVVMRAVRTIGNEYDCSEFTRPGVDARSPKDRRDA